MNETTNTFKYGFWVMNFIAVVLLCTLVFLTSFSSKPSINNYYINSNPELAAQGKSSIMMLKEEPKQHLKSQA
ncbi:hypothetical protein OAO18_07970 [Francisellaceae bacterium]|nr:hypothetical protein [Francisellaceae bacterium]